MQQILLDDTNIFLMTDLIISILFYFNLILLSQSTLLYIFDTRTPVMLITRNIYRKPKLLKLISLINDFLNYKQQNANGS